MHKLFLSLAAAGFMSCLSCDCIAADSGSEQQTLQTLQEINRKLDAIDDRLKKLEGKKPAEPIPLINNNTNRSVLGKITLPDDPTREQAEEYIQKIINASIGRRAFHSSDPQVAMLERVGNKNLDLLLKHYNSTLYVQLAIQNMVTEGDKEVILKAFKENRNLIWIVLRMGWEKDVKDLIIQEIKANRNNLSFQWIEAAASFNDPKTYPDLIEYFINGSNLNITYNAIRKLPGIELKDAVCRMWDRKRLSNFSWERDNAAMIAAEWGHADALIYLISRLKQIQMDQPMHKEIQNIVKQTTGLSGSPEELVKWFKENSEKLTFDEKNGKYIVKKAENAK